MRSVIQSVVSAAVGGLVVAVWLLPPRLPGDAQAQEGSPVARQPSKGATFAPGKNAEPEGPLDLSTLTPEERVNVTVYENVNRSVANITTKSLRTDGLFLTETAEGAGSGSILDKTGHILTNLHVVEDARQVSVTLHDGKSYEATFVGSDPINDVAVIKVDAPPEILHPVVFGESSRLRVGMRVFAIGNPFGLERTLTTGIISSLNRSLQIHGNRTIKSIIQIDAAINPGNSGGPLVDTQGRLIGMNTAIASKTGQNSGVGFAIPVNLIARIVPQLVARGKVVRPEIGISRVYQTDAGLLVAQLVPGGPAEKAGLRGPQIVRRRPFLRETVDRSAADLIKAVDGVEVKTADDFLGVIEGKSPGDQVTLTIVRDKREMKVPVRLGGEEPPAPAPE
jgi:S1-C subfamily serine protease